MWVVPWRAGMYVMVAQQCTEIRCEPQAVVMANRFSRAKQHRVCLRDDMFCNNGVQHMCTEEIDPL